MRISCLICREDFNSGSVVISLNCGHLFHKTCEEKWNTNCPTCRTFITSKFQIHFAEDNELRPTDDLETKYQKTLSKYNGVLQEMKNISNEKLQLSMLVTTLAERLESNDRSSQQLNRGLSGLKEERDKYLKMAEEAVEMKKSLKKFKRIKSTLQSSEEKISKAVKCTPVTKQAVNHLIQKIEKLKEQADRNEEKRKQLISNQNRMRREISELKASSKKLEAEKAKLRQTAIKN